MALLANCNRNPEKQRRPYTPDQFNAFPPEEKPRKAAVKVSMGAMMSAIFDRDGSRMAKELSEHGFSQSDQSRTGEC